jgi:hypothetical protein
MGHGNSAPSALRKLTGHGCTRARRSRPVQTGPDDDHGRQRQDDVSRECKLDPSLQVGPNRHHSAEDRDANGDRHPLARGHEAGGEPFMSVRNVRGGGDRCSDDSSDVPKKPDEERWDQQPERVRLSAKQDQGRGEATLDQHRRQEDGMCTDGVIERLS